MRTIPAALALLVTAAAPITAQATRDQARIAFTLSLGYSLRHNLWSVPRQPVFGNPLPDDTFSLARRIRPSVNVGFAGIYFPGDHLGYTGEAYLLGVGFEDDCHLVHPTQSGRNSDACTSINTAEKAATAVAMNGGLIYRIASRAVIAPYAKAAVGVLFTTQSSVRTTGQYPSPDNPDEMADVAIYTDKQDSRVSPTGVLAVGFTSAVGRGYQVRWELRDNIAPVRVVTGPTQVAGIEPPTATRIKHLFSFNVGFDVVLERRRGHRY